MLRCFHKFLNDPRNERLRCYAQYICNNYMPLSPFSTPPSPLPLSILLPTSPHPLSLPLLHSPLANHSSQRKTHEISPAESLIAFWCPLLIASIHPSFLPRYLQKPSITLSDLLRVEEGGWMLSVALKSIIERKFYRFWRWRNWDRWRNIIVWRTHIWLDTLQVDNGEGNWKEQDW